MAFSKVILDSVTLMDVTGDTVAADKLLYGETATKNDGTSVTGSIASKTSSDLTSSVLTVTAPAGHYASDASKTLTDANLVAGNIKKDISIFGVTGSYEGGGGGGGLVYESGTYTPAQNSSHPTISFLNSHSTPPMFAMIGDVSGELTDNHVLGYGIFMYEYAFGISPKATATSTYYGRFHSQHRTTGGGNTGNNITSITNGDSIYGAPYYITNTAFMPASSSQSFVTGVTYKWIAVWAPTT